MSKVLRTAALVVGAVAAIATAIPTGGGSLGAFGAALASAAPALQVAAVGLTVAATLTAKRPKTSLGGDQTKLTLNREQGLPYPMGRTFRPMMIVFRGGAP